MKLLPDSIKFFLLKRLLEITGITSIFLSFFVFISIISYSKFDPNIGGYIGANTSEILLQTFGYSSYLICVVLISWSYKLFFSKNLELFALNILMLPVTIFLTSFLFEISNFNLSNGFVAEKLFLFVIEIELIRDNYLFYSCASELNQTPFQ